MIKKILMLGISPSFGGTESVIFSMLPYWYEHGLIFDYVNTYERPLCREDELKCFGSNIWPLNLRRRGRLFAYLKSIRTFIKEHHNEYDGIWINIQEPEHVFVLKMAKKCSIPLRVVVAHNAPTRMKSRFLHNALTRFERWRMNEYTTLRIAVSSLAAKYAFGDFTYHVLYSGIDISKFAFAPARRKETRNKLHINAEDKLFISAGRFSEQKNQKYLLEIFKNISEKDPGTRFAIIGRGELEQDLRSFAKHLSLARLQFVTDCNDISGFLDAADAFVFPSLYEGMGMVLIEAQCSGLPCFASSNVIPREACLSDSFTWVGLDQEPARWADIILSQSLMNTDQRREGVKSVMAAGLASTEVAQKYLRLINEE